MTRFIRLICAGILFWCAWLTVAHTLPLWWPVPAIIAQEYNGATLRLEVPQPIIGFSGCTHVSWQVEGVTGVYFGTLLERREGVGGDDYRNVCPTRDTFAVLEIVLPDDSRTSVRLPLVQSVRYMFPAFWIVAAALVAAGIYCLWPILPVGTPPVASELVPSAPRHRITTALTLIVLLAVVFVLYWPARYHTRGGDWEPRNYYSYELASGTPLGSPHFFYELLNIAIARLIGGSDVTPYFQAATIIMLATAFITAVSLFIMIAHLWPNLKNAPPPLYLALVLALLLWSPIFFPTLPDFNLHHGYIPGGNVFHNPPYQLMRPTALILFLGLWMMGQRLLRRPVRDGLALAALIVLSLITKPNAAIVLIPVAGLWVIWVFWRQRKIAWMPILCLILPAVPVLLWQVTSFIGSASPDDATQYITPTRILIAPLAAQLVRDPSVLSLGLKLLLSVAFPLAVYTLYRKSNQDAAVNLGALAALIGIVYGYLLVEESRLNHGNFLWSAQIGLDLWFIAATVWWWRDGRTLGRDGRYWIVGTLWGLHIAAGVIWQAVNMASGYAFFWW
ncbi:MAG: hypothetical protein ACOYL5_07370 [Phototrophicaceae bacterium]